jgi:hypothetical protein
VSVEIFPLYGQNAEYNRAVVLPVAALLKQYKENPTSTIIRHFDLLFIQQSIGKLTSKVDLPKLAHPCFADRDVGATRFASRATSWTFKGFGSFLCHSI